VNTTGEWVTHYRAGYSSITAGAWMNTTGLVLQSDDSFVTHVTIKITPP
jgi:hypothetical protein